MRFWLDKAMYGYRMGVINLISKDQRFSDADDTTANATSDDAARSVKCQET